MNRNTESNRNLIMMGKNKTVITGASVWTRSHFEKLDVAVSGDIISDITSVGEADTSECEIIDAEGLYLLPGLVDMHVHLREPGYSSKETIRSGTASAARGGFTTVCAMPNVNPVPDSVDNLRMQTRIIETDSLINVLPFAAITRGRMGCELVDFDALEPYVAGFSDDGTGVQDEDVMRMAMHRASRAGAMLAAHCEVESMLHGGYINDGEYARLHDHRGISAQSEWAEVARDIRLAATTGCHLHICHVSTAKSVALIRRAKHGGICVTCETAPHYLAFCDEDLQEDGRFKMNPPLRSRNDMMELRRGVIDGTIDVIATDHAPHTAEEKSRGLEKSAMGVVGLETALPAVYTTMVESGMIPLERLVQLMSDEPRRLLGIKGGIAAGCAADLVLVDFSVKKKVDPECFATKGRSTPFAGMTLSGEVVRTYCRGRLVYDRDEYDKKSI